MIKVSIQKNSVETNAGTFADQPGADAWIASQEADKAWGKPARQVASNESGIQSEDISKATASEDMQDEQGNTYTLYTFAADYTIVQTDITAQVAQAALVDLGLKCQNFGAQVIAQIFAVNEASGINSSQLLTIMADPTLAIIERLLWNGSIKTARAQIAAYSGSAFTGGQINAILALIDASGLAV